MNQDEYFDEFNETAISEVAKRFENMLQKKESIYFSEETFESLSEYYLVNLKFDLAMKVCNAGLKHYEHSLDLMINKVQLLVNMFELEEATELIERASLYHPSETELEYFRGVILAYSGEYQQALEHFLHILPLSEEKENIYFQIASAYQSMGKMEDAMDSFKKAVEMGSKNEILYSEIVFCFEVNNNLEEGIVYFNELISADPYNHTAWFALGLCYNTLNLYEKGAEAFDYAVTISEDFTMAWYNLGCCYMNLEDYAKAKHSFYETLNTEEPNAEIYTHIAASHEKLEEFNEAYKYYKLASEIDETWDDAWFGMGSVLYEQDKYMESIHFVKKAIKLNDLNSDYWLLLGDNEAKLGNLVSSHDAYFKASELDPINPDVWLNWSLLFFDNEDYARAFEIVYDGIDEIVDDADLYYRSAIYLMYDSNYNEAYKYLQEGLLLDYDGHVQIYDFFSNLDTLKALQRIIDQFRK